jgi:hypothetical protein
MSKANYSFSLQCPYGGRETYAVMQSSASLGVDYQFTNKAQPETIPVGTVEFCAPLMGVEPLLKSFFPEFLQDYVSRFLILIEVLETDAQHLAFDAFVKSATEWKGAQATSLFEKETLLKPGIWWLSEPVQFINEWRYYVADGDLVTAAWYSGKDQESPAPPLSVCWPKGFSGAVDFGELQDGRLELVEAHAPYGCGWYGDSADNELFTIWQALAWESRSFWLSLDS